MRPRSLPLWQALPDLLTLRLERPEPDLYPWRKLRAHVRARDGNRCRNCRATEKLSVHHVRRGGPDRMDNLITLCSRYHYYAERAVL